MVSGRDLEQLVSSIDQLRLECRDEELRLLGEIKDQACYGSPILRVQGIVKLVHDVEGSGLNLEDRKEERSSHNSLLSA